MAEYSLDSAYKATFDSVITLSKSSQGLALVRGLSYENNVIKYNGNSFHCNSDPAAADSATVAYKMEADGASWFRQFRTSASESEAVNDGVKAWNDLLNIVAEAFHSKYAYVEYIEGHSEAGNVENKIRSAICGLFPSLDQKKQTSAQGEQISDQTDQSKIKIEGPQNGGAVEDLFCAFVCLELSKGIGEPKRVLGQVYFRKSQTGQLEALGKDEATRLNEHVLKGVRNDNGDSCGNESATKSDGEEIKKTIDSVIEKVADICPKFDDYFIERAEADVDVLKQLTEPTDTSAGALTLTCNKLSVQGIAHVSWINQTYDCFYEDKRGKKIKLFVAEIGLNDKMSLRCANCTDKAQYLIESDKIAISDAQGNAIYDDGYKIDDEGKIPEKIDISTTIASRHNRIIECEDKACVKIVCDVASAEIGERRYCKDCPYPEKVSIINTDGDIDLTENLSFARKGLRMIKSGAAGKCACCQRTFAKSDINGGLCEFCKRAETLAGESGPQEQSDKQSCAKLYRKYSSLLPISVRLKHLSAKKYCMDDNDLLLFVFVKESKNGGIQSIERYAFDKLQITDGELSLPIRYDPAQAEQIASHYDNSDAEDKDQ